MDKRTLHSNKDKFQPSKELERTNQGILGRVASKVKDIFNPFFNIWNSASGGEEERDSTGFQEESRQNHEIARPLTSYSSKRPRLSITDNAEPPKELNIAPRGIKRPKLTEFTNPCCSNDSFSGTQHEHEYSSLSSVVGSKRQRTLPDRGPTIISSGTQTWFEGVPDRPSTFSPAFRGLSSNAQNSLIENQDSSVMNGDDHSEKSEGSASTSGCSSLVSHKDRATILGEGRREDASQKEDFSGNMSSGRMSFWPAPVSPSGFNLSAFMGPSKHLDRKVSSPFYRGKTTFGGASASRRIPTSVAPYQVDKPLRNQIKFHSIQSKDSYEGMSSAAKRILQTLEKMSSPVTDAKKIPNSDKSPVDLSLYLMPPKQRKNLQSTPSSHAKGPPIADISTISKLTTIKNYSQRRFQNSIVESPMIFNEEISTIQRPKSSSVPLSVPSGGGGGKMRNKLNLQHESSAKGAFATKMNTMESRMSEYINAIGDTTGLPDIPLPITSLPTITFESCQSCKNVNDSTRKSNTFVFSNPIEHVIPNAELSTSPSTENQQKVPQRTSSPAQTSVKEAVSLDVLQSANQLSSLVNKLSSPEHRNMTVRLNKISDIISNDNGIFGKKSSQFGAVQSDGRLEAGDTSVAHNNDIEDSTDSLRKSVKNVGDSVQTNKNFVFSNPIEHMVPNVGFSTSPSTDNSSSAIKDARRLPDMPSPMTSLPAVTSPSNKTDDSLQSSKNFVFSNPIEHKVPSAELTKSSLTPKVPEIVTWICDVCYVRNEMDKQKCIACESTRTVFKLRSIKEAQPSQSSTKLPTASVSIPSSHIASSVPISSTSPVSSTESTPTTVAISTFNSVLPIVSTNEGSTKTFNTGFLSKNTKEPSPSSVELPVTSLPVPASNVTSSPFLSPVSTESSSIGSLKTVTTATFSNVTPIPSTNIESTTTSSTGFTFKSATENKPMVNTLKSDVPTTTSATSSVFSFNATAPATTEGGLIFGVKKEPVTTSSTFSFSSGTIATAKPASSALETKISPPAPIFQFGSQTSGTSAFSTPLEPSSGASAFTPKTETTDLPQPEKSQVQTFGSTSAQTIFGSSVASPAFEKPAPPGYSFNLPTSTSAATVFQFRASAPAKVSWECSSCQCKNDDSKNKCDRCNTAKLEQNPPAVTSQALVPAFGSTPAQSIFGSTATSSAFGKQSSAGFNFMLPASTTASPVFQFKTPTPASSTWKCSNCQANNEGGKQKCDSCNTARHKNNVPGFTFKGVAENKPSANSLKFNAPAVTSAPSSGFSFNSTVPVTTNSFAFGVKNETTTSTPSLFSFGAGSVATSKPALTAFESNPSPAPSFQFGSQTSAAPASTFGANPLNSGFTFGSKTETANPLQPAAVSATPAFGGTPTQSVFGINAATPPVFGKQTTGGYNFGLQASSNATPVFQFGAAEKKPASSGFSFGTPAQDASNFQTPFNISTPSNFNFGATSAPGPFQFAANSDNSQAVTQRKIRKAVRRMK